MRQCDPRVATSEDVNRRWKEAAAVIGRFTRKERDLPCSIRDSNSSA